MAVGMACVLAVAGAMGQNGGEPSAKWNPAADPKAIVTDGNARFTVLTPAMIRMEWSPDGQFEDRASFAFVNRRLDVPAFKVANEGDFVIVDTGKLRLRYRDTGHRFGKHNLSVAFTLNGKEVVWNPRLKDAGNLLGTTRTLDGVSGSCPLEPGLLSRDGWTLVDDSQRLLFDDSDWPWAATRKSKRGQDWYFFGYGHDYKQALLDFTKVAGKIPLPPRFVFGAWWSRYWAYSDEELRDLVGQFRKHGVPLDVLVIDMDWHLDGWTGYTWNPKYFPDPEGFLKWVHEQGLRTTLNLHPADGVGKHEKAFPEMAKAMGLDPEKVDRVPFDCTDRKYMNAYFDILHHPMEKQGVDFWWIDYQQKRTSAIAGLDPLFWLNYLHWTDMERREEQTGRRPILFSRWGGLGNHRYQIGFSGDTFSVWPSLAFQPYFTATAGNVGYGYWSHDIGGHQPGPVEPELYARWIQWGAISPMLRTHTTKNPKAERRIWEFPKEVFESASAAFRLRYDLIPYIYTMARKAYDKGLPLCRPLYYEWPELDEAYAHGGEYLFGDDMLVTPVVEPADPLSGCAMVKVWLPPGDWTNWFTGRTYHGPCDARLLVPLDEIPLFVRGGAIIPTQPKMNRTGEKPVDPLILNIFPGDSGETRVYEDDGIGPGYKTGECAWTPVSHKLVGDRRHIIVGPVEGAFPGMPKERQVEIRMSDVWPPKEVRVDGKALPSVEEPHEVGWRYDRNLLAVVIRLPTRPATKKVEVVVVSVEQVGKDLLRSGFRGQFALLRTVCKLLGDHTPAVISKTIDDFETVSKETPTEMKNTALHVQGHWFDYITELTKLKLESKATGQAFFRLLGLYCKLNVTPAADAENQLDASADVIQTLAVPALEGLDTSVELAAAPPWRVKYQTKASVTGAPKSFLPPVPAYTAVLDIDGPPGTGVLRATVTIAGKLLGTWESTKSLRFDDMEIRLTAEKGIQLPIETTFLPSINAWWIVGPFEASFEKALDTPFPPEKEIDLKAQYQGKDDKPIVWKQVKRTIGANANLADEFFVNLTDVFGGRKYQAVAYALAYLHAPEGMDATLALGTDDGVIVWLNGKEVHRTALGRAYMSRQDRVPVQLKKGTNTLLLKISQGGGDWGFCVHVEDAAGKPLTQVTPSLAP